MLKVNNIIINTIILQQNSRLETDIFYKGTD